MTQKLFLMTCVLLSTTVFAQTERFKEISDAETKDIARLTAEQSDYAKTLKTLTEEFNKLNETLTPVIDKTKKDINKIVNEKNCSDSAYACGEYDYGCWGPKKCESDNLKNLSESRIEIAKNEKKLNSAKGSFEAGQRRDAEYTSDIQKTKNDAAKETQNAKLQMEKLQSEITNAKLGLKGMELKNKFTSLKDNLEAIENSLDEAIIAVYLNEKMKKMSANLCKAQEACGKNEEKENVQKAFLNGVFNEEKIQKQISPNYNKAVK
ncbi:MAG TPA: hypothetical protein PLJ21_01125 [Pseudobdellovibrionaceae bacterium]|nr:hypothetical protein [Pseudobdellovibrionaceae bacterium]